MISFYLKITLILQISVRPWLSMAKIASILAIQSQLRKKLGLPTKKKVRESVMSENTLFLF